MKILMVCLGNICRSPLAHGVLQYLSDERGLGITVDSAGTGDWHVGQAPDRRSIAVAKKYGVDISTQRAQHFNKDLFDKYDRIFVMDHNNLKDVLNLATSDQQRAKVLLFLENEVVPDPYYDDAMFEPVYAMVHKRCIELLNSLK